LAAGPGATCAWTARGAVACWGPDPGDRFALSFDDIVQVSVGMDAACGLHATGGVSCWSNGSGNARSVPGVAGGVGLAGAHGVGAVVLCARLRSGDVACGNRVRPFAAISQLAGATSVGGAGSRYAVLLPGHRLAAWVGGTGVPLPRFLDGVDGERA